MKGLIVNADDFGRTRGVNAGVVEAHLFGIVTSATVMVLEPAAEEGVSDVRRRAPRLSLGLHFAVTGGGLPASSPDRVPSLLVDGRFRRFPADIPRELPAEEIARELDAQLFLFEKMAGAPPSHLDSHHHSALHPSIQPVFAQAAIRLGIPVRASNGAARESLRAAGIRTPDRFVDAFYGEGATAANLRSILAGLAEETTELMCHPGYPDERLLSGSSYARERERERTLLCDPELKPLVAERDIQLISFRDL
ncbi:MAG TPA: ChbG/HpnK family deacetylase [Thermoanaerobaculia bacterium]|nr:ChbG/HpnK family deacetylase [Thermoanaerobaculia bacterium]